MKTQNPTVMTGRMWKCSNIVKIQDDGRSPCDNISLFVAKKAIDWLSRLTSPPTQYGLGGNRCSGLSGRQFYRSKDPTNSIKVLNEKSYKSTENRGKGKQHKIQQHNKETHIQNTASPLASLPRYTNTMGVTKGRLPRTEGRVAKYERRWGCTKEAIHEQLVAYIKQIIYSEKMIIIETRSQAVAWIADCTASQHTI